MSVKNFIINVVNSLGLHKFTVSGKKKSIKNLLKKLKKRRVLILKSLRDESDEKTLADLQEELDIISLQIHKGKELLNKLNHHHKK